MGTRAIKAKIICDKTTLGYLWRSHCMYNQKLSEYMKLLFKLRRGKIGKNKQQRDDYKRWFEYVIYNGAKNADYNLNALSINNWTPNTAKKYITKLMAGKNKIHAKGLDLVVSRIKSLSDGGILAFDKDKIFIEIPYSFSQLIIRDAVAGISGHDALVKIWKEDHKKWRDEKKSWEDKTENKQYLKLQHIFKQFSDTAGGVGSKKRGRWFTYLCWLSKQSALANWRGNGSFIEPFGEENCGKPSCNKGFKSKLIKESKKFFDANPELFEIHKLHQFYEKNFIRPKAKKHNIDGFEHPPTFTLPDPVRHPIWACYNAPQTNPIGYKDLVLPKKYSGKSAGSFALNLLTGDIIDGKYPKEWVPFKFIADKRLSCFKGKIKVVNNKIRTEYIFEDPHLSKKRQATIGGIKIILKDIKIDNLGHLLSATPYVVFACDVDNEPISEQAKKLKSEDTGETGNSGLPIRKRILPEGCLISCAVDLGIRNLGFATLAESGGIPSECTHGDIKLLRSYNLLLEDGPSLEKIAKQKKLLGKFRRLRGKPIKGEKSHVFLQNHITKMGVDRFNKAARLIVNFALNTEKKKNVQGIEYPRADVIVLENLAGLIPDAAKRKGINKALMNWNRGHLVKRIQEIAHDSGYLYRVYIMSPWGSSQVCCKCKGLGRRYSIIKDENGRQIQFGNGEKLFACANCRYMANADHNASINLHHIFKDKDAVGFYKDYANKNEEEKQKIIDNLEAILRPHLQKMHFTTKKERSLDVPEHPLDVPF